MITESGQVQMMKRLNCLELAGLHNGLGVISWIHHFNVMCSITKYSTL